MTVADLIGEGFALGVVVLFFCWGLMWPWRVLSRWLGL